jgi:hypothetical protein
MKITPTLLFACVIPGALLFAGGPGSSAPRQVSLHIPNETAPPDGVAQMKFMVTEPTPISSGKPALSYDDTVFDSVLGVELFNPIGSVNGVAMIQGPNLSVQYTNSNAYQGTDYPIMTIALHVRPDALPGSQTQFSLDPSSVWVEGLLGTASPKPAPPATITVGGSISITNVVPGGGLLPAGSVVSVRGIGFEPQTQVQLNIKASSIAVISPQEIQITLAEATDMTGKKIQVVNPDGSQDTYFSYMRGIMVGNSARPLLAGAVPIFSTATYSYAVFAALAPPSDTLFTGLALQNPGQAPANITVALYSPLGVPLGSSSISLAYGYRMMREISELTGGAKPVFGSYVVVSSPQPVQVFGFAGDDTTGSVSPFTPVVARP